MLIHLAVNNYAIVDTLELELGGGMSVITGETGAGKSIMLDALALTLGDRADSGAVRPGADKADILATFDIRDIPEARQWLDERDCWVPLWPEAALPRFCWSIGFASATDGGG